MRVLYKIDKTDAVREGNEKWGEVEVNLEIALLTEEQRKELVLSDSDNQDNRYRINSGSVLDNYNIGFSTIFGFGHPPTHAELVSVIEKRIQLRKEKLAKKEERDRKEEETEKKEVEEIGKILSEFLSSDVEKYITFDTDRGRYDYNWPDIYGNHLTDDQISARDAKRDEIRKIVTERNTELGEKEAAETQKAKEQYEKEKSDWIAKYGSDHLRAVSEAGYKCEHAYAKERAILEIGEDVFVDFDRDISWDSKVMPSMPALKLEKKLKSKGFEASIQWITGDDDYDREENEGEPFQKYEAVMIENFLGNYRLFVGIV